MDAKSAALLSSVVSAGVGLAFGYYLGHSHPSDLPSTADDPEVTATVEGAAPAAPVVVEKVQSAPSGSQCETMLAFAKGALQDAQQSSTQDAELIAFLEELVEKSGASSPDGKPMAFPERLAPQFAPEGFAKALDAVKAACPDVLGDAKSDCSEFPCKILVSGPQAMGRWDENRCPAFSTHFGNSVGSSSSRIKGPKGDLVASAITPWPTGEGVRDYLKEYEGNLNRRDRVRFNDWINSINASQNQEACDGGDPDACAALAQTMPDDDPRKQAFFQQACDAGSANACNNLAWSSCHDRGVCDETAEANGRRATELAPTDGKGAWDTYAYTLCRRGQPVAAQNAYAQSCKHGAPGNCDKKCE